MLKATQGLALALLLLSASASDSQVKRGASTLYSADRLVHECRATIADFDSTRVEIGAEGQHCLGYVQGFIETATMWQVANKNSSEAKVPLFCATPKVTNEVIIRRIPIWALEHPEDAKGTALELLMSMLAKSYPCTD